MLKNGVGEDKDKQQAAEAFINFNSRPDNAIRNMYYIGYTSVISGGDDPRIFEYADWNYSAEDEEEDTVDYDLAYFFTEDTDSEDSMDSDDTEESENPFIQYFENQGFFR